MPIKYVPCMARARHSCKTWWHSQPLVLQTKYFLKYHQSFDYTTRDLLAAYRIYWLHALIGRIKFFKGDLDKDPDFKWEKSTGPRFRIRTGLRREKMTHKNRKTWKNFMVWSAGYSMNVLYCGLGIDKLQILIKKLHIFSAVNYLPNFGNQNPKSGSVFSLKMLDPDLNPDPKHWRIRLNVGVYCTDGRLLGTEEKDWMLVCTVRYRR